MTKMKTERRMTKEGDEIGCDFIHNEHPMTPSISNGFQQNIALPL